eukprot:jgi/Psemu1/303250/fgenesh1_kg.97_\
MRSPFAKSDEYGVTELLREVSQRNSSLTVEERKEVGEIVKRVEQRNKAKSSPIVIMKKKLAEMGVGNDVIGTNYITTKSEVDDVEKDIDDDTGISTGDTTQSNAGKTEAPASVKKLAKDFFQKFSNKEAAEPKEHSVPNAEENRGNDLFRSFSINGMQQNDPSRTEEDKRPEILKAFEQSSESGRDMLRNLSKKFQAPLSSSLNTAPAPSAARTAAAVSESFRAIEQIQYSNMLDLSDEEETIVFSSS